MKKVVRLLTLLLLILVTTVFSGAAYAADPVTGAIWTTDKTGEVFNGNVIYETKEDVYLNGGPSKKDGSKPPAGVFSFGLHLMAMSETGY